MAKKSKKKVYNINILKEHGLNPQNLKLPDEVMDVCTNIMQNCNREIGVLCGIDFMLNKNDSKWYYLENQAFPAIDEWAYGKRIKLPNGHNIDSYLEILKIELQTRYESLLLTINQRNQDKENYQPRLIK